VTAPAAATRAGEAHFVALALNGKSLFSPVVYGSHPRLRLAVAGAGDRDDHPGVTKTL
jgi:hypothetical protein